MPRIGVCSFSIPPLLPTPPPPPPACAPPALPLNTPPPSPLSLPSFLDTFYMSRIGVRILIGQYLELHNEQQPEGYVGLINSKTSPAFLAEQVGAAHGPCSPPSPPASPRPSHPVQPPSVVFTHPHTDCHPPTPAHTPSRPSPLPTPFPPP